MDELKKTKLFIRVKRKNLQFLEGKLSEIGNVFSVRLSKFVTSESSNSRVVCFNLESDRIRDQDLEALLPEVQVM